MSSKALDETGFVHLAGVAQFATEKLFLVSSCVELPGRGSHWVFSHLEVIVFA